MKTVGLLPLLLVASLTFGQNYFPIPESNATWIQASFWYMAYNNHDHATVTQVLTFGNDSLKGGINYHTLHGQAIADWSDGWGNQQTYQSGTDYLNDEVRVLFRQDIPNKRVYQWDINTNQEQLLYDFGNLVVGQPYPPLLNNMHYPQIMVVAHDSILLADGFYHNKWVLGSDSNDSGFVSIIEGVGSTMGFDLPIAIPFEQSSAALCLSTQGSVLFDNWNNVGGPNPPRYSENCEADLSVTQHALQEIGLSVWPNPVEDLIHIRSSDNIERIVVLDMVGNVLLNQAISKAFTYDLDFNHFHSGNYLVQVYTDNQRMTTRKLVK